MYLGIMKSLFIFAGCLLTLLLIIREFGITKKISPMKASDYVSLIAGIMFVYVVCAFLIAIFFPGIHKKITMILFGLMPFIIGKLVTYKKVHFYSIIQMVCIIPSIVYAVSI